MQKYRLRLTAKGQMTVPAAMREELGMKIGDELEVAVEGRRIIGAQMLTAVPVELFTPELLKELENKALTSSKRPEYQSSVEELKERVKQYSERKAHGGKVHTEVR